MNDIFLAHYTWIKAFHLIAVISWMAGMLYLPRLFVYHTEAGQDSRMAETFCVMERRLLRYIINPAMIVTWILGGTMLYANPDLFHQGWVHGKLTLLLGMQIVHAMLARHRRQLSRHACIRGPKYFRILNEVPTALMIGIVILAVVKPF